MRSDFSSEKISLAAEGEEKNEGKRDQLEAMKITLLREDGST